MYVGMTKDEAQQSRWTFCEAVIIKKGTNMLTVTEAAQSALKDYYQKQNLNSALRVFLSQGG